MPVFTSLQMLSNPAVSGYKLLQCVCMCVCEEWSYDAVCGQQCRKLGTPVPRPLESLFTFVKQLVSKQLRRDTQRFPLSLRRTRCLWTSAETHNSNITVTAEACHWGEAAAMTAPGFWVVFVLFLLPVVQKILNWFAVNSVERWGICQGRNLLILVQIQLKGGGYDK